MLLWKRYGNNNMEAMRIMSLILHLQQYSHRLNLLYFFSITNFTSNDLGSKAELHGKRSAIDHLYHGIVAACISVQLFGQQGGT